MHGSERSFMLSRDDAANVLRTMLDIAMIEMCGYRVGKGRGRYTVSVWHYGQEYGYWETILVFYTIDEVVTWFDALISGILEVTRAEENKPDDSGGEEE